VGRGLAVFAQVAGDLAQQVRDLERLCEVVLGAHRHQAAHLTIGGVGADDDDGMLAVAASSPILGALDTS
jgi:hypothetical protein